MLMNRVPYPVKDGGAIAMYNMLEGMHSMRQDVFALALNTKKHLVHPKKLPPLFSAIDYFDTSRIDTNVKIIPAVRNLFSNESYHISRFYSENFEDKIIKLLKATRFDIIHIEMLQMTLYLEAIRRHSKAKVVLRTHNVEHLIWERLAAAEKNPLKKTYLKLLAKRLKDYELSLLDKVDAIVPITSVDKDTFTAMGIDKPIHVSPTGLDMSAYTPTANGAEWPSVFHLGSMDWMPNLQAITWFLQEVWPKVNKQLPNLTFYVAGRHMPAWLKQLKQPGVQVVAEVEDAKEFIDSKSIMVVPLQSGSGMRIKIIEGMAMAKTIIATSIGAEGIGIENNNNIIIADSASTFADAIIRCANNQGLSNQLGQQARAFAEEEYDNKKIIGNLLLFYNQLIKGFNTNTALDQIEI